MYPMAPWGRSNSRAPGWSERRASAIFRLFPGLRLDETGSQRLRAGLHSFALRAPCTAHLATASHVQLPFLG